MMSLVARAEALVSVMSGRVSLDAGGGSKQNTSLGSAFGRGECVRESTSWPAVSLRGGKRAESFSLKMSFGEGDEMLFASEYVGVVLGHI